MKQKKGMTAEEQHALARKKIEHVRFLVKGNKDVTYGDVLEALKAKFGGVVHTSIIANIKHGRAPLHGMSGGKPGKAVVSKEPPKLKKEPVTKPVSTLVALPTDVAELVKAEMKKAKDTGAVFIVDLAKLEEDIKRLQAMAEKMRPHGYSKLTVTGSDFEIVQPARTIKGTL